MELRPNAKYKDAATELVRLRIKKEASEVIPIGLVREGWGVLMRGIRQFVLGIPGQVAFVVPTLFLHDRSEIERICRDGLQDLSLHRGMLNHIDKLDKKYDQLELDGDVAPSGKENKRRKPEAF